MEYFSTAKHKPKYGFGAFGPTVLCLNFPEEKKSGRTLCHVNFSQLHKAWL